MTVEWRAAERQLHLANGSVSYVLRVHDGGALGHLHFGAPLALDRSYAHLGAERFDGFSNRVDEPVLLECPTPGVGDFRVPALVVEQAGASSVLELRYAGHTITAGKPGLAGLPATYVEDPGEAETLEVALEDAASGIRVELLYTIFRDLPVVARSARIVNRGTRPAILRCAMSASLDLPDAGWRLLHLSGAWARERHEVERRLAPGRQAIGSLRGASGHEHNPFLALLRPDAGEAGGQVVALGLVYSGNFVAEAEVDPFGTVRVRIGIHPEGFAWHLDPGQAFTTPEATLAYNASGLDGLSDSLHRLYRDRLARGSWRDRPRPVVVNSWEAVHFTFDEDRLVEIARAASELGVELFVLDDGWFGRRDDDLSSLGDWTVDGRKLPSGLEGLARRITDVGLQFGLWFEPEMVSPDSRLFEARPDWAVGVPGRPRTESRNQYVLDFARPDVVDHVFTQMAAILSSAPVSYVKWDMNRNITEPYSAGLPAERQGEFHHRYMLGVYDLWSRLTKRFPEILFESCAGGGGRFDPGLLAFAPQTWTSDDTDAIERLRIQWGTSIPYPLSAIAAHVSAVPNHQVGRVTPIDTRAAVAFFGVFGYELDPAALSAADRARIVVQVAFYKEHRQLFQSGRFIRLLSPFATDGADTAWMVVAGDRRRAIAGYYRVLNRPNPGPIRLRMRGLEPAFRYRVTVWPEDEFGLDGEQRGGDELMSAGLVLAEHRHQAAVRGDFRAQLFVLDAV